MIKKKVNIPSLYSTHEQIIVSYHESSISLVIHNLMYSYDLYIECDCVDSNFIIFFFFLDMLISRFVGYQLCDVYKKCRRTSDDNKTYNFLLLVDDIYCNLTTYYSWRRVVIASKLRCHTI